MSWEYPKKHYGKFLNRHVSDLKRSLKNVILWRLGCYDEKEPRPMPPNDFSYPFQQNMLDVSRPTALWIGHSTYLIQINGLTILTDPVFSSHCSPIPFRSFKRHHAPPIDIAELPAIDLVLISHNHYDHLDAKSVRLIQQHHSEATWIVPRGVKRWFLKRGIERVHELNWGEAIEFKEDPCKITAVPAQHCSGRSFWDQNLTLWCGYVVECKGKTFYFVGDTGYNPIDFKKIGELWPSIDLSLIPIGTYVPKTFMQPVHISPEEAVQIHTDVGSRLSLGMHWKTFLLSDEPPHLPPYDLFLAMKKYGVPFDAFLPIEPGESVNW